MRRLATIVAVGVAGLGIVVGIAFLFAPLGTECSVTATSPAPGAIATPGPEICRSSSLAERQPVWPLPLLAIVAWSAAPAVTAAGLLRRLSGEPSTGRLIAAGLVAEGSVLVSFGAAPLFVPLVLLPLLGATALGLAASRSSRST